MIKKKFTVGEIFRIELPSRGPNSNHLIDGNDIPYVASKKTNNGVQKMCSASNIPKDKRMAGNCIVFIQRGNGSAGYTTYQPDEFYALKNVCCGYIDGVLNENIGLYLVTLLDKNRVLYSHEVPWTGKRLEDTPMLLPVRVDENGEPIMVAGKYLPDWSYMDSYIQEIKHEAYGDILDYATSRY